MNSAFLAARKAATRLLNPHTQQLTAHGKALQKLSIKSNIAVKDAAIDASSEILKSFTTPYDATVTARLLGAQEVDEFGKIYKKFDLIGINNCDEFGMGSSTAFSAHGPTYNPYSVAWLLKQLSLLEPNSNPGKHDAWNSFSWLTCGGSSGGSAVSVSLGLSDASVGTDTGGSVRQPAAFCGVVGLKPSYGRISRYGLLSYANSLDTIGFLSKSVQEAAKMLELTAGNDNHDDTMLKLPSCPPEQQNILSKNILKMKQRVRDYLHYKDKKNIERSKLPLYGFRIGIPAEFATLETELEPRIIWDQAAKYLHELGAEIVQVSIPSTPAALPAYYTIAASEAFSNLSRYGDGKYGYCATDEELAAEREEAKKAAVIPRDDVEEAGGGPVTGEYFTPLNPEVAMDDAMVRLRTFNRSRGFGKEVQRRILNGCAILSANTDIPYYEWASKMRSVLKTDFASVFRSARFQSEENPCEDVIRLFPEDAVWNCDTAIASSPITVNSVLSSPAGTRNEGVDILLTPVSPCSPWVSTDLDRIPPSMIYSQDIMTLPASLAHLPAIAVPIGLTQYPPEALEKDILIWKLKTLGTDAVFPSITGNFLTATTILTNIGSAIAGDKQLSSPFPKATPPELSSHPELVMSGDTMEKIISGQSISSDGKSQPVNADLQAGENGDAHSSLPMWSEELETKVRNAVCVPTSVQLVGRLGDENTILLLSAALEEAAKFVPPSYVSGDFQSNDSDFIRTSLLTPAKLLR